MNRLLRLLLLALGTVVGLLAANRIAFGQTTTVTITVDDPRPLAAAILKIEALSGIPINYEDMPVYYPADLQDVTDSVARTPLPPGRRIIGQRGGQLSVPIVVDATTGKLNDLDAVKAALLTVIAAYNSSGLPGGFDLEYFNGVFFVKPVRFRDESGATRALTPVLSTPITLPEEKRADALRPVLQQVSKATGSYVGLAAAPLNGPSEVTFGSTNEPADHAIARYLATWLCISSGSAACAPAHRTSATAWDIGFHYSLSYHPQWGYMFSVDRVPNSRWLVLPQPAKPYSPPPPKSTGPGPSYR